MSKPLPKWLFIRYAKLWKEKRDEAFNFGIAKRLLREKDDRTLSVILSDLRKNGWLEIYLDPNDARKRTYRLKSPLVVVEDIANQRRSD